MKTPVNISGKTVLVTGSPGFIGANLVIRLINEMERVIALCSVYLIVKFQRKYLLQTNSSKNFR